MTQLAANSQEYYDLFREVKSLIDENSSNKLNQYREEAIEKFKSLGGFPTTKVEDYKYTNIDSIFGYDYGIDLKNLSSKLPFKNECDIPVKDAYTLYLRNGYFIPNEDLTELEKKGIIVCTLQEASLKHEDLFTKYYNKKAGESDHSIVALNTAFAEDGLFIFVPEKTELDKPIQLLNFLHATSDLLINARHLFIVESQAKVQFLDCTHALDCRKFLTNTVVELFAEKNAKAEYYNLQNQFDKSTILLNLFVGQKRDSEVITTILSLHAEKIRNNVAVDLEDENCDNHTYGLYLAGAKEHVDNFTAINHIAPHCNSWEHFKGILNGKATTAFCGRIHVYKDAQKTEAYQTNNNLVLSNNAKANTKPQLIIEADDVSCSHGATVGQLDEEAIYYLQTRGIPYNEAYRLMMTAFMNEVTEKIQIPELKERIEKLITNKMLGKITYCEACNNKCVDQ
ncbi:Fe-S cluster assembly protein SufD [Balneicella halophila]|uniref:Fe-S cluster assembly protein SufD n=1 Tax=Balneicella halophila TaxID=1537566 RepID=A0A7L4UQ53_BALHA|nr:Fe-S cluster assembly protein SufD [Balneicella halophila]PVX51896.1 Fe-S cluster assembly protein SufD [Balneicella halophila]